MNPAKKSKILASIFMVLAIQTVAAAIVVHKYDSHLPLYRQTDIFAASGWTPSRSTLLNILRQVDFVIVPFVAYMASKVQADFAVGLDESSCRMLMPADAPEVKPSDLKAQRLAEKMAEAKAKGEDSILGKMWAYRGLDQAPYNIFGSWLAKPTIPSFCRTHGNATIPMPSAYTARKKDATNPTASRSTEPAAS